MLSCFLGLHLCWLSGRMCISLRGIHFLRGINLLSQCMVDDAPDSVCLRSLSLRGSCSMEAA